MKLDRNAPTQSTSDRIIVSVTARESGQGIKSGECLICRRSHREITSFRGAKGDKSAKQTIAANRTAIADFAMIAADKSYGAVINHGSGIRVKCNSGR